MHRQRGIVQLLINGEEVGNPFDQYMDTEGSAFQENAYGSFAFEPGEYTFEFKVVGKNEQAVNYNVSVDSISLRSRDPGIEIVGESDIQVGDTQKLTASIFGMHPYYASGDYIKWQVTNQVSDNGSNKVVSIVRDGLDVYVTGVNPGTATLKALSVR
jgi:hypothetical protein